MSLSIELELRCGAKLGKPTSLFSIIGCTAATWEGDCEFSKGTSLDNNWLLVVLALGLDRVDEDFCTIFNKDDVDGAVIGWDSFSKNFTKACASPSLLYDSKLKQ